MNSQWPNWVCKNTCGHPALPPDTKHVRCPKCKGPLLRWLKYEQKQPGRHYPAPAPRIRT